MASNKRERELARMRAERQAARRAAEAEARLKRRNAMLAGLSALGVAIVVVAIALATDNGKSTLATSSSQSKGVCSYTKAGTASKQVDGTPAATPAHSGATKVTLTTNQGDIELSLDGAKAPCTTNSFAFLAGQKYFDKTSCHRLTTSGIFVLQCGDPSGSGAGGPGYQFGEENLSAFGSGAQVTYPRGTIAMANAGPGTNGSQFFLVYKDSPLQPNYTPFGTITKGLDLLDKVAKGGSTPAMDGKPKTPVTIEKATVRD